MGPLVYLSIAYGFSELILLVTRRSKGNKIGHSKDKGSMILIWLSITFGFAAGFILSKPFNIITAFPGLLLVISGLIIRWKAIIQLGDSFTVDVAANGSGDLKTDGIYSHIRHPSYLGIVLVLAGFSLTMNSLYSLILLNVPVFLAITYRIKVEEKFLLNEFGSRYEKYISVTRKLIPGIY